MVQIRVEINQCVGCTSPRHRAGAASMAWRTRRKILISTQTRSRTSCMGSSYHMLCFLIRFRSTWCCNIKRLVDGPTIDMGSCGTCSCRSAPKVYWHGSSSAGRSSRINSQTKYIQVYFLPSARRRCRTSRRRRRRNCALLTLTPIKGRSCSSRTSDPGRACTRWSCARRAGAFCRYCKTGKASREILSTIRGGRGTTCAC